MGKNSLLAEKIITKKEYNPSKAIDTSISSPPNDNVKRMYKVHKYWARKPWYVVSEYIKHFTKEGECVLDPFCGSGVTGIEAIANNRKAVMIDLNPIAVFITKNTARTDFKLDILETRFQEVRKKCEKNIRSLYLLDDKCPKCKVNIEIRHLLRGPKFSKPIVYGICSKCEGRKYSIRRPLRPRELQKLEQIESKRINYWYPRTRFPAKFDKDRISYKGIKYIYQMFTKRNLYALSLLWNEIENIKEEDIRDLLKLCFLNTLLHVSKLKAENVRPMAVNNYWVPDDWIEENVWYRFNERYHLLQKGKEVALERIDSESFNNLEIHNTSALKLSMLKHNSVDYIFTDPPYGDSIQYSELSMIWNAWLENMPSNKDEAVINPTQSKGVDEYGLLLETTFKEMFRVLRKGRWLSVCFHNKEFKVWRAILQACKNAGFILVNAVPQEPISQSFTQAWSQYASKTDMIINLIKPYPEDIDRLHEKFGKNGKIEVNDIINRIMKRRDSSRLSITDLYDRILVKIMKESFFSNNLVGYEAFSVYKIDEILSKYKIGRTKSEA
jgi:DNA modification methylase